MKKKKHTQPQEDEIHSIFPTNRYRSKQNRHIPKNMKKNQGKSIRHRTVSTNNLKGRKQKSIIKNLLFRVHICMVLRSIPVLYGGIRRRFYAFPVKLTGNCDRR